MKKKHTMCPFGKCPICKDNFLTNKPITQKLDEKMTLNLYLQGCEDLADTFVRKYFGKEATYSWIADEVGGVIEVADRFFSVTDIADFLRYKYSTKMLFEYYDRDLECRSGGREWKYNIYSYKKLRK